MVFRSARVLATAILLLGVQGTLEGQDAADDLVARAATTLPHARQLAWHSDEFIAFVHFGPNTFTGREWGTGTEDPAIFAPTDLDTDSWCEAMVAAGMKKVILTAKHHDGFCLWQTRYTKHSVASSPWRGGKGDVVRDLAASCRRYGMKLGIYLSPADLYQIENAAGLYGNRSTYREREIPRPVDGRPFASTKSFRFVVDDYNEYFLNQLFELLTEYGPIDEVWFDGATPKSKGGQRYTYQAWYALIRDLVPDAVIFGRGPDIRWCGNESGKTRDTEWNVICVPGPIESHTWPDLTGEDLGSLSKLREGMQKSGVLHYHPAETDTSIRHGWFWRDEAQHVKSAAEILDIWNRTVGGNSVFLLNIPPNRSGRFAERDVAVLRAVGRSIRETYATNLVHAVSGGGERQGVRVTASSEDAAAPAALAIDRGATRTRTCWMPAKAPRTDDPATWTIRFEEPVTFDRVVLQEDLAGHSQRIARFAVDVMEEADGVWREITTKTTIGYKRILCTPSVTTRGVRVRILESRLAPTLADIGLYLSVPLVSSDEQQDSRGKEHEKHDP
ncbi:MAG: alpha-L-fucosidase [Planctomycetes bacterium]|nr:alpha-L-fucosidase [Planctomycetota bacterium]